MAQTPDDLDALAAETLRVYERQAAAFDAQRLKTLYERAWLDRFADGLPAGGHVLDLGCGTGDPIAAYLAGRGLHVVGLDQSHAMLAIARTRYPDGDWRHGDMRTLDLPERFDGMLGWNSFFHLRPDEQRALLPRLAAHLAPGGSLMLTVGPRDSEAVGHVGGEPVYHSSLAPDAYAGLLAGLGLGLVAFVAEDPECDFQSVLLARRTP